MFKAKNESTAAGLAKDHGLQYGLSVFDGCYYVGTGKELDGAGVAEVLHSPTPTPKGPATIKATLALTALLLSSSLATAADKAQTGLGATGALPRMSQ